MQSFLGTLLSLLLFQLASPQKINVLGTSGGNGPKGGLGDLSNPVRSARAIITDALIPTTPNSTRQLAEGEPPVLRSSYPANASTSGRNQVYNVTIDSANGARQELLGFGHAWTDSAVEVFNVLEPDVFDLVMKDLFGQDGNNMGMMRHTIGSSDLSYEQYSYDDNGPDFNLGSPDLNLSTFDLGYYGGRMADMIAKMGSYKSDVTLFGSPWSAPAWMKRNGLFIAPNLNVPGEGTYCYTNNSFNFNYIPQYAQYFAKYIDAFKDHGVTVNAITPENEPLNNEGGYPCMFIDAADEAALAQALGPLMQTCNVGIWVYDHNTDQPAYPQRAVEGGGGYVQAAAWHCYASPVANYSVMDDFHYQNPDLLQFMTECSNYKPKTGTYNFEVADSFIRPVQHWASGSCMWVMATDSDFGPHSPFGGCDGCSGSIIVNTTRSYIKTNDFYMIGQFSRFVRRGAINYNVVEGNYGSPITDTQFYVIAARNPDQSWAVIFMNNYNMDQDVILKFTDTDQVWQGTVPNGTVTTWLLPAAPAVAGQSSTASPPNLTTTSSFLTETAAVSTISSTSSLEMVPNTTYSTTIGFGRRRSFG